MLGDVASQMNLAPLLQRDFVRRRISEGETGRLKHELRCEACGKGYKHISSLTKHLWEHTPEWRETRKLLMLKHQHVQLLEAASILVGMHEPSPHASSTNRRHSTIEKLAIWGGGLGSHTHDEAGPSRRTGGRAYLASQFTPVLTQHRQSNYLHQHRKDPSTIAAQEHGSLALTTSDEEDNEEEEEEERR